MDETYIKQCDCPEIQEQALPEGEVGGTFIGNNILYHIASTNQSHDKDGYYHVTDTEGIRRCGECGNEESYIASSKYIWLPRQDQLQEMVNPEHMKSIVSFNLIRSFSDFCLPEIVIHHESLEAYRECQDEEKKRVYEKRIEAGYEHQRYIAQFTSMEQLWLAFVMKEKYGKVWDGGEWVKADVV